MRPFFTVAVLIGLAGAASAGSGDVNADAKVTVADAIVTMKIAGGLIKPTAAQQFAADVVPAAPDGVVTIADAVRVARIALGVDPAMPAGLMPVTFTLLVAANATCNIALAGGYPVSGRLTDSAGAVFTGEVAFQHTTSKVVYGPWTLTDTGAFAGVLPAGIYQPVAVTERTMTTANGETEDSFAATAVGAPLAVAGTVSGLVLKRPAVPAPPTLTLSLTGPSKPFMTHPNIYFTDTGATPATFGLNYVSRDVAYISASIGVPNGVYNVESVSAYTLSTGLDEALYIWVNKPLTMNGATAMTITYPQLYELVGAISCPPLNPPLDLTMELQPTGQADATGAYVQMDNNYAYVIAVQPGLHQMTLGVTSPYPSTAVDFVMPYTMPAANSRRNITLPSLPVTFRTISGKVLAPMGGGAAGVGVFARMVPATVPTGGVYTFSASAVTDANGAYSLNLPDGTYTITATP